MRAKYLLTAAFICTLLTGCDNSPPVDRSAYAPLNKGDKGDKGDQGAHGSQGNKGDQGLQGLQGAQGVQGAQGDQGLQGLQGAQGLQGMKGDKGDKGDQGDKGEQGVHGFNIIVVTRSATNAECPNGPGTAADFYQDRDFSGDYTGSDLFQGATFSCNGNSNGSVDSTMIVNNNVCYPIDGADGWVAKRTTATRVHLWSSDSSTLCQNGTSTIGAVKTNLAENTDDTFWIDPSIMLLVEGSSSTMKIYTVTFQ